MERKIEIVDHRSGKVTDRIVQNANASISPTSGDTVRIGESRAHVVGYQRDGLDLIITFDDGTTLRVSGYFNCPIEERVELIFIDQDDGEAWRAVPDETVCFPTGDTATAPASFHYELLLSREVAAAASLGWLLPVLLGGGVAAIAIGSGGGGKAPPPPPPGDTTPPAAPVVNSSNGTVVTGTAEPGSTVKVDVNGDGVPDLTTTADAQGRWTVTPATPLPTGTRVTATATDAAGNVSGPGQTIVDATAPAAPVIDPSNGTTLTGTAEPGSTVKIDVNGDGVPDYTVVAGSDGTWTVPLTSPIPDGTTVTATATDAVGNVSGPGQTVIDAMPPAAPVVNPTDGTTIGGTAEPGSTIKIDVDGDGIPDYTTVTGPDGTWTVTPDTPIPDGTVIGVVATDPTGNSSPPTPATVDAAAPVIAIDGPVEADDIVNAAEAADGVVIGGTTDAEDGQTVTVTFTQGGNIVTAAATVAAGGWSVSLSAAQIASLGDGTIEVTATVADIVGNVATPATHSFTVDTVAPGAPGTGLITDDIGTITGPVANGGVTDDSNPAISGSGAEPGATVNIYDGATLIGTTTADPSGNWTFTPTTPLADGPHSISSSVTDVAGNEGPKSAPTDFIVDTSAPAAPVLGTLTDDVGTIQGPIAANGVTDDAQPTITGTGVEPNSSVNVYDNGVLIGTTTADGTGAWSFAPSTPLVDGPHSFTASNVDAAGNESPQSTALPFTVDTAAPSTAPAITNATDDVAPVTGNVASGGTTNDSQPALTGNGAEPNSTVNVYDNGTLLGTAAADGTGAWTFTPAAPLVDGAHGFTVSSVDAAGNEGPQSAAYDVIVDAVPPTALPAITDVVDDVAPTTGVVAPGSVTNDPSPTVNGTLDTPIAANETVHVFDMVTGADLGVATVTGTSWTFQDPRTVNDGDVVRYTAQVIDAAGGTGPVSAPYEINIVITPPTQVATLTQITDDTGAAANDFITNDQTLQLSGTLSATLGPDKILKVFDENGVELGAATVTGLSWTFDDSGRTLAEGVHSYQLRVDDTAGNQGPLSSQDVTIDLTAPTTATAIIGVTDDVGTVTGVVASGGTTDDPSPTVNGTIAAPLQAGETVHIFDGATDLGIASVIGTSWTFADGRTLTDGQTVSYTARVVDAAGNEGPQSAVYAVTVDTTAPGSAPTIDSIDDNVAPVLGVVGDGDTTNDPLPQLTGSGAEPNSNVNIYDNGVLIGTASADGTGAWTFTPTSNLADGAHAFTVSSVDAAGNEGPQSATPFDIIINTVPPAGAPAITSITDDTAPVTGIVANGGATNDTTPLIAGIGADPNATVNVYDNGVLLGTTTADGTGAWSFATAVLPTGSHSFTASNVDGAGNEGPQSAGYTITLDTTAPATAPAITSATDDVAPVTGAIADGGTTNDAQPALTGNGAEPNSTVNIYDNGTLLGTAAAGGTGAWTFTPATPLVDGAHAFTVSNVDAAGNEGPQSAAYDVIVDTAVPAAAPAIDSVGDDVAPVVGNVADGGATNDTTPLLTGSGAEPNSTVNVYDNGTLLGTAVADGTGLWSFTPAAPLIDGAHAFTVSSVDAAGNEGPQSATPYDIIVDTAAPAAAPVITGATDDIAPVTGNVADGGTTNDAQPALTGNGAEPNSTVNVYDNGTLIGTAAADGTGLWSFTPVAPLVDGAHAFTVSSVDAAGNEGPQSGAYDVTVDTAPPAAAPTIDSVDDDVAPVVGTVADGGATNDTTPLLTGSGAEPNSTVNIYDNGTLLGTAAADGTGAWTFTPATPLVDGAHAFTVSSVDAAGNEGPQSAAHDIIVDTAAPAATPVITGATDDIAPVTGNVADGGTTNDAQPALTGNGAEPNSTVNVYDNGTLIGTAAADGTGLWSFTPVAPLVDGAHAFTVSSVDAAGNEGPQSGAYDVTVDTAPPAAAPTIDSVDDDVAPVVGTVADGGATNDTTPLLTGSGAEPNSTVNIYDNGTLLGTAAADGTGAWTFTPATPLVDGAHAFTVSSVDAAGNEGPQSAAHDIIVDTAAPAAAPVITGATDDIAPVTGNVADGGTTNDAQPALTGNGAEPNSTVNVYDNGTLIGTAAADGTGLWSFTPVAPLVDGAHAFTVSSVDAAGNEGPQSGAYDVTVDTAPPAAAPTIDSVDDDVAPVVGTVADGGATNDTTPLLTGSGAEPNSTVNIYDNGTLFGTAAADGTGAWTFTPATPLVDGAHAFTVSSVDAAGNEGPQSAAHDIIVDTAAPAAAPVITGATDDIAPVTGNVADGGTTNDAQPALTGNGAEPNSTVNVYDNGTLIGTAAADGTGLWSFTPVAPLVDGAHAFTVSSVDAAGNEGPQSGAYDVTVDTAPPAAAPTIDSVDDDVAPVVGTVADGGATNDTTPLLTGSGAEPNSTVNIYDNGTLLGTAAADGTGAWTFTPATPLVDGAHAFTVSSVDAAGNEGPQSAAHDIIVDTAAPAAAPVITGATDDIAPVTGNVADGGTTNDAQPALTGNGAEPNSTVNVYDNGTLIGTAAADGTGLWSFTPVAPLVDGAHAFTVSSVDAAGNEGPQSGAYDVTVDTAPPAAAPTIDSVDDDVAPVVGTVADGGATNDTTPLLTGSGAEPNSTVNIYDNGTLIGTAAADGTGLWSFTPAAPLVDGAHAFTVSSVDAAGNEGPQSAAYDVIVDTAAPATAPTIDSVDDDVAPVVGTVADGGATNDTTPLLTGSGAEPNSTVNIYDNGTLLGTAAADGTGAWTFTPATPLVDGAHAFTVSSVDAAGNEGPQSAAHDIIVDTAAPAAAPVITGATDDIAPVTGNVADGGTTNDAQPALTGNGAEPNSTVNVYDNGTLIGTAAADGTGLWSFTPAAPLVDGAHAFTVSSVDAAGNEGPQSGAYDITVDTGVPAASSFVGLTDDVGTVQGPIADGGITDDTQPTFAGGGAEPNSTVNIYDNGTLIGAVISDGTGAWTFTPSTPLAPGAHSFTSTVVDAAGNESTPTTAIDFTLDTTAPATAPTIINVDDDVAPVTSNVADGGTTNDAQPALTGNGAEPNSTVNIYDNGTLIGTAAADGTGAWSFTPVTPLVDGAHAFTVSSVDAAGNEGPQSAAYDVIVDTAAPATAPTIDSVDDDVAPVVGTVANGGATNDTTPLLTGSGAEPNSTVNIYDNGILLGTAAAGGTGAWTFTPATPLVDGAHAFTVSNVDAAGNEGPQSAAYDVIVDTAVPAGAILIDSVSDDTGTAGDFVTSDTTLTVFGHLTAPLAVGETLQVSIDNGTTWIDIVPSGTNWTYVDGRTLTDGAYDYQARIVSPSGIPGAVTTQTVTVDTAAPATIAIDSITDDTGTAGDFITSDTSLTVGGTLSAALGAGETAQISIDGGTTWIDVVPSGTSWSYVDGRTLGDGSYVYQVRTIDAAGNASAIASQTVTVDTTAPGAILIDAITDDTGDLGTDFLTSDTTLTVSGHLAAALAAGETAQISIDNGTTWIALAPTGTNWSYADGRTLADGAYDYQVRIIDAAGNAGAVATQTVTVDTTMPNMLTGVEILDSIDPTRGTIADSTTTNDSSPEIHGTGAEPNSIVNIYNGEVGSEVLIGSVRADGAGNWSFTPSTPLADNPVLGDPYAWSASNVDAAGVEGNKSAPLHFRVDTLNPADSMIVAITDDSGTSGTDFVTNDPTITLSGTFSQALTGNDTAQISVDGGATWTPVTVGGGGTTWTYTPPAPLADGAYFYEVVVTDTANNVGASDTQKVVIDTTPPGAITIASIDVDSGASPSDFITSDTSIVVNGTLAAALAIDENAETAQISIDGGTTWIDLVVTGTSWSYADARTLADGPVDYQVRIIDLAGNVGPVATQTVTIDTTAPATPAITAITDDTGTAGDLVTSDTSLTISGTLSAALAVGDLAQISIDGGATWIDVSVAGTSWSYVDGRTLADGSYTYQIRTLDLAGNIQNGAPQTVTVDTTAPTQAILIDSIEDDTGTSASDFLTSDTMPTVLGHLSAVLGAGETAQISIDGGTTWTALSVVGTGWSYAVPTPLAEGANTVSVRVIDAAGNTGPVDSQVVTIDTVAPTETAAIISYTDDAGLITGNFGSGTSTDDSAPVLNGTLSGPALAGEVVHIYEGATLVGTVALNAGDTSWTFSGLTGLGDGPYSFTARVADPAGNESAASAPFTITVDTVAPVVNALTINNIDTDTTSTSATSVAENADFVTRDTTLRVSGVADIAADGILQISTDGGTSWTTVPVVGTAWSYTDPTQRTSNVTYQLRVIDAAGNVAASNASQLVTLDVAAPVAGVLAPVLIAADDTGTLGDNVTTDTNLTFSSAQSGLKDTTAWIGLVSDVNNNGIYDQGIDSLFTFTNPASGAWSLSATLTAGQTYNLGFVQFDAAGNYSRLSPTTEISIVAANNNMTGGFTGVSNTAPTNSFTAGMGSGIDQSGRLQFTVRRNVATQTSQTTSTNETPPAVTAESITNNTFLDYNRDGNIDFATAGSVFGDNSQSIFTGQADGTHLGYRQNIGASSALGGVVAFDKEGDGYLDLIWGDWGDDNASLTTVRNNAGTLTAGTILVGGTTVTPDREVSGVDIDNDGDIDLALHSYIVNGVGNINGFTSLINNGSGVYSRGQTTGAIFNNVTDDASSSVSMTWADFDGDGDLDLYLNRTNGSDVSGIFTNNGGVISATKTAIGDTAGALAGGASVAVDWNHDGKMDVVEFANSSATGPIQLYLNTSTAGALGFGGAPIQLATGQVNIGGASTVDYDWDGDSDIVYQTATDGLIKSIANTNQVQDGTALHLRIIDQNGVNSYYGNTVQLFDSRGNLVATQIINPQSGVGANDSTGIVNFYGLSATETYTAALVRTVNGVSQDIGGAGGLTGGAANLSTIENINQSWAGLAPGSSNGAYVLSGEAGGAINNGTFAGTGYNDVFFGTSGNDSFVGAGGWSMPMTGVPSAWSATIGLDIVDYGMSASGVTANLAAGTATGQGTDTLSSIEGIRGTAAADIFTDSVQNNLFEGRGGNDTINLAAGGRDVLVYKILDTGDATGGNGADTVNGFTLGNVASTAADTLDLRDLLRNYAGTANTYIDVGTGQNVLDYASTGLTSYLNVVQSGGDTLIQVDINGTGSFTTVATLTGVTTTLPDLLANHQLWVASNDTGTSSYMVTVTPETTADTTPIVSGTLPFALATGGELRVIVNGVSYSSDNVNEVVVDPLNNTWYLQVPTALAAGTYNVTAAVFNSDGSIALEDPTVGELVVQPAPTVTFGGSGGAANKATALTVGEDGAWRIFSNDTIYDSSGTSTSTLGSYSAQSITVAGQQTQNATFMDYNRDGYIDVLAIDQAYFDGQQAWTYNGSTYTPFQVAGSGATSAIVYSWYAGVMAYDKNGDGYVDLVYGDNTPDDSEAGGGYDTGFVVNNAGTFIKDGNYVATNTGTPAPTNVNNSGPDKEVSGVDINNDGAVDVVYHASVNSNTAGATTSFNANRLVVVTNSGNTALTNTQILDDIFVNEESLTSYVPSMTWADFNGDGTMDLFLARGATNAAGTVTTSEISRIYYNNAGTLVSSTSGGFATSYLGDSLAGGASFAVDWNADGRMDAIELPRFDLAAASPINLYTNGGGGAFATSSLAALPVNAQVTGGLMLDLDWDGDRDLLYFQGSGTTGYIQNSAAIADGTSLHLRIVDPNGINSLFGNTVQIYDSAGNLVASRIINPQSGNQTNDSSAIVDFYGLNPNETYSAVLLRNVGGASQDVGGLAMAGAVAIENVNAAWNGLRPGEANDAYVLTAEAGNASNNASGVGIVGTGYNDTFFATAGTDIYEGGGGTHDGAWSNTAGEDVIDFKLAGATGVTVDLGLATAQATGFGTVTLRDIEGVAGGNGADVLTGNAADNLFEGRGGNDLIHLDTGGKDTILLRLLNAADATGGNGMDTVTGFKVGTYEGTPDADRIDLKDLLVGYTGDADGAAHYVNGVATLDAGDAIANYLQATVVGGNTVISVDRDGSGGAFGFTDVATLQNVQTDLATLLANHQLVAA